MLLFRILLITILTISLIALIWYCINEYDTIAVWVALYTLFVTIAIISLACPGDIAIIEGDAYYQESVYQYQNDTIKTYNAKWKINKNIKQIK